MTHQEEAYEIATLATVMENKREIWMAHAAANVPSDPIEREKGMATYYIAHTEFLEAEFALRRAQHRIANKA